MWHQPLRKGKPIKLPLLVRGMDLRNRVLDRRARRSHQAYTVERLCPAAMNRSAAQCINVACSQNTLGSFMFCFMLLFYVILCVIWYGVFMIEAATGARPAALTVVRAASHQIQRRH